LELLVLPESDCLKCNIKSYQGYEYKNILIENSDWHTKQKLLKAIGHQDCVFLGSDNDVQALCNYINQKIPVRKTGTKTIGLHNNNTWVVEGMNITREGINHLPLIIPYEKGAEAFYHKIKYSVVKDDEYSSFIKEFYSNILNINEPQTILPWIG